MPLKTDRRRAGWGVFPLLTVLAAVMVAVGIMPIFTGSPKTHAEEVVECNTVYDEKDRELTIPINIAPGSNNKVKRFSFDGLAPGEKVTGFEFRNTTKAFTSTSVSLIVNNRSGELSDIPSLTATGINQYEYKPYGGQLSDGDKTLKVTLPSATAVAYPQGPGISGRIQIELPNSDTNKSHYAVIAKVQTERKECTTKTVTPSTSEEPSSVEPTPTTPGPTPSTPDSPTSVKPEPTTTTTSATLTTDSITTSPESTTATPTSAASSTTKATSAAPTTTVDPRAGTGLTPTQLRPARNGEVGIRISAAAFRYDTSQYSAGIKFRLWTANESGGLFDASDRGPQAPINADWATCTTGTTGECIIYVPSSYTGKYGFVVQENEYPGTYHIGQINWGTYGNYNNRTNAFLPGFVNIMNMRTGSTDPDWGKVFSLDSPELSTWEEIRTFGSSVQSLNNPPMEKVRKCQATGGPRIALVLDTTASIKDAGGDSDYKNAVYGAGGFLDSIVGTGGSVAFFPFSADAKQGKTSPVPVPVDTQLDLAKANARKALSDFGGTTNWQSGFESVLNSGQKFDQIVFVTDGDANTWYVGGTTKDSVNIDGSVRGVEAGVYAANELKAKGTRVVSIGVASAKDYQYWNGSGQLKAVSGPDYGVDYFGTDWSRLAGTLRAAASEVTCQIEFEVNKQVVSSDGTTPLADQSAAEGWKMSLNVSGIPDPQADIMTGTEKPPFGYLSGDANQVINSSTASVSKATHGTPASVHWNLTQYADPKKSNTTAVIGEDVNSKSGYEFVPGESTYEVQDARTGKRRSGGPLQSASQTINGLKPGDRVVVKMVNRFVPQISLQKDLPNGRRKDGDQFELSISKVTGYQGSAYADSVLGSAAVTQGSGNGLQKTSDGKTLQAGPFKLESNTTYLLRENAAAGANLEDYNTELKCTGATASPVPDARRGGSGRVWQVSTGPAVKDNITCTFTNTPVLKSSIAWKKVDNESKPLACSQWMLTRTKDENGNELKDQQWAVNDNASGCTYGNTGFSTKDDSDTAAGLFKVADLPLGTYVIEEVRAPNGYGVNNQRKSATIELTAAKASAGVTITDPFVNYPDVTTPGTLPRTGGVGIGTTAGIAGMIVALGCVMLRRRQA